MKEVIVSIQPKWCNKIFNGTKTIEVRKSVPRCRLPMSAFCPFKCLIYCTKQKSGQHLTLIYYEPHTREYLIQDNLEGHIVGEFICDRIYVFDYCDGGYIIDENTLEQTCLTREELKAYGRGKRLYGWHISSLTLCEEPMSINVFGLKRPPQSWQKLSKW